MEYYMSRCWLNKVCVSRGLKARIGSRSVNPKLKLLFFPKSACPANGRRRQGVRP